MSGRRRRSETIWDDREERRASADIHSNVSPDRSQYWSKSGAHDDIMHGKFSRSPSRDPMQRNRNGPRDDDIRRDRNRMYSHSNPDSWEKQYSTHPPDESYGVPYRSRDKGPGGNMRMNRERMRSPRRSRSRSPRRETDAASYQNMRNNSKDFASRGGPNNNMTETWSRRTDYKGGGSRYNDYRNTRPPCKFFAAGNCNRDHCKFSHDVVEPARGGYDDNRNSGSKNNRTWHNDQQPHDELNAEPNLGEMEKKKSRSGSVWNDTSDDCTDNTWDTWDDKKNVFDGHASRDASGFHDVGKSHSNVEDNKRSSWNGPTSWDGVSGSGFSNLRRASHNDQQPHDELNVGEMEKKKSWNGSVWNDVESGGQDHNTSDDYNKNYTWDTRDDKKKSFDNNAKGGMCGKSGSNVDRNKTKKWDGPLWDEVSEPVGLQTDNNNNNKVRNWDAPSSSKTASHTAEIVANASDINNIVSEGASQQIITSGKDLIQTVHDTNTKSFSYVNGSEQRHMLSSNPLNGQGQGMYVHMENQNKEGGTLLKPLEMDVPQPRAVNDVFEATLIGQLAPLANAVPDEMSHKGPPSQLYTESNLANAIDYLKSLPNYAYNQDTTAKEEQDSARNMEVNPSVPMTKEAVETIDKKEENTKHDNAGDEHGKVEEGDGGNDEKAMRLFKVGLVEFVKEILKPKWKEGKMSRDVHKTVVKKVVEKVTSTIQGTQIPRTQQKIDQYLAYSKPKITKLVEAYMERLVKS